MCGHSTDSHPVCRSHVSNHRSPLPYSIRTMWLMNWPGSCTKKLT